MGGGQKRRGEGWESKGSQVISVEQSCHAQLPLMTAVVIVG